MNKTDLVSEVAAKARISKVDAKKAVDAVLETVSEELGRGGRVAILGFGTFSVAVRSARTGLNPQTKEAISIPARKVVKFKVGAGLASVVE